MNKKKLTIAIDGFSSCGKSTLAKALAEKLNYIFIDTGAMYRGVTLHALRNGYYDDDGLAIDNLIDELPNIELSFQLNEVTNKPHLLLNHKDVEEQIRSPRISSHVSEVAAVKEVREKLVAQQRIMGKKGGVVMDGRDIGSVVFPNAELKLFLTADPTIRAQRRFDELHEKGISVTMEDVKKNLLERDHIDSTRIESPLIQTDDAIVVDNSFLNPEQQLSFVLEMVEKKLRLQMA